MEISGRSRRIGMRKVEGRVNPGPRASRATRRRATKSSINDLKHHCCICQDHHTSTPARHASKQRPQLPTFGAMLTVAIRTPPPPRQTLNSTERRRAHPPVPSQVHRDYSSRQRCSDPASASNS